MALTNNQRTALNKVAKDFAGLKAPADAIKGQVRGLVGDVTTKLKTMTFSDISVINSGITTLNSQVADVIPGALESDIYEIRDIIDDCDYLSEAADALGEAGQVTKVLKNSSKAIFDKIGDIQSGIALTIPEFDANVLLDTIMSLFDDLNFPGFPDIKVPGQQAITDIMKKADKLINCLDIQGGAEYVAEVTEYTADLNDLYSDLHMVSNPLDPNYGELDKAAIYSDAGMAAADIAKMETVNAAVRTAKNDSVAAVSNSIDKVRSMKLEGLLS